VSNIRELYHRLLSYSKEPKFNFASGFLVGILGMATLFLLIKLVCKLVRFVWFLLAKSIFPHVANFCRTVGPPFGKNWLTFN
jgi:hypothetical protein